MSSPASSTKTMAPLPDDVLLCIFSHADIDTFLTVRLLNRHVHELINTHANGLVRAVAQSTFPNQTRILTVRGLGPGADGAACLGWLKGLRYEQLAAIMLECREGDSVAAEDPLGDPLRHMLARGWRLLHRLATVAHEVESAQPSELPYRGTSLSGIGVKEQFFAAEIPRELEICARRLAVVEYVSFADIRGYLAVVKELLEAVFGFPDHYTTEATGLHKPPGHPGNVACRTWVTNYLLKMGAARFWRAWKQCDPSSSSTELALRSDIETARASRNGKLRKIEADSIVILNFALDRIRGNVRNKLWKPSRHQRNPPREVRELLNTPTPKELTARREELYAQGQETPPRTLQDVPYKQTLNAEVIGSTPVYKEVPRRWNEHVHAFDYVAYGPMASNEFRQVYEEWHEGWRERKGWEEQVAELREKLTEPEA